MLGASCLARPRAPRGRARQGSGPDGARQPVLTSERRKAIRDRYTVTVPDPRLDFRVAASMTVALDALRSR